MVMSPTLWPVHCLVSARSADDARPLPVEDEDASSDEDEQALQEQVHAAVDISVNVCLRWLMG